MSSIDYTAHYLYQIKTTQFYLVSSLRTRKDATIIYIDSATGDLVHRGIPQVDVFPSVSDAIEYLKQLDPLAKEITSAAAIIGYIVTPKQARLFLATQVLFF
ncbi:hypothetical protein BLNAU_459 [Blattamonas nauphoetae]|uniref:Uncharacterized protein n=1 Tax=Blattamonas nauphoetae TaxID=2049346 RepID=A0ABQ9YLB2_9EUKA|nr:hypothetical protein BLNAU_459 [Blattamonas nauphoetae]